MKNISVLFFVLISQVALGQTFNKSFNRSSSLLLGSTSESDIKSASSEKEGYSFPSQTSLDVSTKDQKLEFENQYNFHVSQRTFFHFGVGAGAKMNNSAATFFNNSNIVGGATGSIILGLKTFKISNEAEISKYMIDNASKLSKEQLAKGINGIDSKIHGNWFYISPSFEGRKFKKFDPTNSFDALVSKSNNTLWSLSFGYNYWNPSIANFNTILGVSFTPKKTDNFSDLEEVSISDQRNFSNDSISRAAALKYTAFQGDYNTIRKNDLNIEAFINHNSFSSLGLYLSYNNCFRKALQNRTDISSGIFFSKANQPTNPDVGIVFTFNDITDNYDLEKNDKFTVNLVTRINLSNPFR
ncbi:MAG: hypothetical protein NXI00_19105 [Cytophagales bacterium]|nr:hypothetical protein [Cytophagales bacterium]